VLRYVPKNIIIRTLSFYYGFTSHFGGAAEGETLGQPIGHLRRRVCVCVNVQTHVHAHTHTHTFIYVYM